MKFSNCETLVLRVVYLHNNPFFRSHLNGWKIAFVFYVTRHSIDFYFHLRSSRKNKQQLFPKKVFPVFHFSDTKHHVAFLINFPRTFLWNLKNGDSWNTRQSCSQWNKRIKCREIWIASNCKQRNSRGHIFLPLVFMDNYEE